MQLSHGVSGSEFLYPEVYILMSSYREDSIRRSLYMFRAVRQEKAESIVCRIARATSSREPRVGEGWECHVVRRSHVARRSPWILLVVGTPRELGTPRDGEKGTRTSTHHC